MKTVKLLAESITVLCPHCDEPITNPCDGSFQWTPELLKVKDSQSIECLNCAMNVLIKCKAAAKIN